MAIPDTVYHYASPRAFMGIVENSTIWATDFRYLNDTQELKYAWDEFIATLAKRGGEPGEYSDAYRAALQAIRNAKSEDLAELENSIYVACFSELPDDVNQWDRYAEKGTGVAIGFDREKIQVVHAPYFYHTATGDLVAVPAIESGTNKKSQLTWGSFLQQVQYGEEAREAAVAHALWEVEQYGGKNDAGSFSNKVGNAIFRIPGFLSNMALVKHADFKSESEWRLAMSENFGSFWTGSMLAFSQIEGSEPFSQGPLMTLDVKFREGEPAGFKPYTKLSFNKSALVKVILGPGTKDKQLGLSTTRRILDRYGFRHTQVEVSTSPLRPS